MSGRDVDYEEYKAGRRERPDLLREHGGCTCTRSSTRSADTNVKVDGYEADDVIAMLADRGESSNIDADGGRPATATCSS